MKSQIGVYVYKESGLRVKELPRSFNMVFDRTEVSRKGSPELGPKETVVNLTKEHAESLLNQLSEKVHGKTFEDLTDEIDRLLEEVEKLNRELDGVAERGRHNVFTREL